MSLLTNLNASYKFDTASGNAVDDLGVNNLTNVNTATYGAGKINNGAVLSRASTQYFSHATASAFEITGDMSLSIWIKIGTAPTSGQQMTIIGKDANGANNTRSYDFTYENSGGTKRFNVALFPTGYSYPGYWNGTINYDLGTGTWHHVVITVSIAAANGSKVKLWIDGADQGFFTLVDGTGATSIQNSTSDFQLGYLSFMGALDGGIDIVELYSKTLDATDVSQLYNSGNAIQWPFSTGNSSFFMFA